MGLNSGNMGSGQMQPPNGVSDVDGGNVPNYDSGIADQSTIVGDTAREGVNDLTKDFFPEQNNVALLAPRMSRSMETIIQNFVYRHPSIALSPMMTDAVAVYVDSTSPVQVSVPDGAIACKVKYQPASAGNNACVMSFGGNPTVPAAVGAQAQNSFLLQTQPEWFFCYGKQQISLAIGAGAIGVVSFEWYKQDN